MGLFLSPSQHTHGASEEGRNRERRRGRDKKMWHKKGVGEKSTRRRMSENAEGERENKQQKRRKTAHKPCMSFHFPTSSRCLSSSSSSPSSSVFFLLPSMVPFPNTKRENEKGSRQKVRVFVSLLSASSLLVSALPPLCMCMCVCGGEGEGGKGELKLKARRCL